MPKKVTKMILWDTSHYETMRWETAVKELSEVTQKVTGLEMKFLKGNWNDQLLSNKKLLKKTKIIILTGLGSQGKISKKELSSIEDFVKDGGSLFLSAPSFKGEDTNSLATLFGAEFLWNKIEDEDHHEGNHSDHVIISIFGVHPISKDIKEFCFGDYGGFPLKIKENVTSIAKTSDNSNPPNATVLASAQYGKGRVVFASCSTTFKDKYLNMYDNKKLAENIFSFLATTSLVPEKASVKETMKEKPITPIKQSQPSTSKYEPEKKPASETKIVDEFSVEKRPITEQVPKTVVSEAERVKKSVASETPAPITKDIEQEIDKLDEKLVFGEIDEITYEVEKIKVTKDLESLNQLVRRKRIGLTKYMEIQNIISSASKKSHSIHCAHCNETLFGIEKFCPNCGEKIK